MLCKISWCKLFHFTKYECSHTKRIMPHVLHKGKCCLQSQGNDNMPVTSVLGKVSEWHYTIVSIQFHAELHSMNLKFLVLYLLKFVCFVLIGMFFFWLFFVFTLHHGNNKERKSCFHDDGYYYYRMQLVAI